MASIRKRGQKWRAEVRRGTFYKTKSFFHKETALNWARSIEVDLEREEIPGSLKLVSDGIRRYLREVTPNKKGARWERVRFTMFLRYPVANKRFCDIRPSDFAEWRDFRLTQVSPASVRREMGLWSGFFTICVQEWQWIADNPLKKVAKPKAGKSRDRVISDKEQAKILKYLSYYGDTGEDTGRLMQLAIETGMRLSEMVNLKAVDVFSDYVILRDSKNNDTRHVPLTKKARKLAKESKVTSDHASILFRRAARSAKIQNVKFHDTRHTAATRLAQKISVLDLCRMFGWKDPRYAMIYYNPSASELAKRLETSPRRRG